MEDHTFDTVFSKSYDQLTEAERAEMKDLFISEDEFLQVKMVMQSIDETIKKTEDEVQPAPEIKEKLDHLYHQTYQNKGVLWYNTLGTFFIHQDKKWHQQNLTRIAAVLLVGLLTFPLWFTNGLLEQKTVMAKVEQPKEILEEKNNQHELNEEFAKKKLKRDESSVTPPAARVPVDRLEDLPPPTTGPNDGKANWKWHMNDDKNMELVDVEVVKPLAKNENVLTFSSSAAATSDLSLSEHPDGVFFDAASEGNIDATGFKVKDNAFVLDLITATY